MQFMFFWFNAAPHFYFRMTIEALDVGLPLPVEATRDELFVFGHHMGKADLKYLDIVGDGMEKIIILLQSCI